MAGRRDEIEFRGCVHFTPENFGAAVRVLSRISTFHLSPITFHVLPSPLRPLRPLREAIVSFASCAGPGLTSVK
jgi:hypothetical protein